MQLENHRGFYVYPELKERFGISYNEYLVLESIRYLSTSKIDRLWGALNLEDISKYCCVSIRTVSRTIRKGLKSNPPLITKHPDQTMYRTSPDWNGAVIELNDKAKTNKTKCQNEGQNDHNNINNNNINNIFNINTQSKFCETKTEKDNYPLLAESRIIINKWNDLGITEHKIDTSNTKPDFLEQTIIKHIKLHGDNTQIIIDALSLFGLLLNKEKSRDRTQGLTEFLNFRTYEKYLPNQPWYPINQDNCARLNHIFTKYPYLVKTEINFLVKHHPILGYLINFVNVRAKRMEMSAIYELLVEWWEIRKIKTEEEIQQSIHNELNTNQEVISEQAIPEQN
jgi:hypothetical protein